MRLCKLIFDSEEEMLSNIENVEMSYHEFINTRYWKQISQAIKIRDGEKCMMCGSRNDLQAHHMRYPKWKKGSKWNLFGWLWQDTDDLVTLCDSCHKKMKQITDERKQCRHG